MSAPMADVPTSVPQMHQTLNFNWETQPVLESRARPDDRSFDELRPLTFAPTNFTRADGSVRLTVGGTVVLAAVSGPLATDASREDTHAAVLDVVVRGPVSGAGGHMTPAELAVANLIRSVFTAAVAVDSFPRTKIAVRRQIVMQNYTSTDLNYTYHTLLSPCAVSVACNLVAILPSYILALFSLSVCYCSVGDCAHHLRRRLRRRSVRERRGRRCSGRRAAVALFPRRR